MSERFREREAPTAAQPAFAQAGERPTGRRSTYPTLVDDDALEDARRQSERTSLAPVASEARTAPPASGPDVETEVEVEVVDIADASRPVLSEAALRHAIGPLTQVPTLLVSEDEVLAEAGGPTVAFVVGFLDGATNLRTVVDATGLPALETLAVVHELLERGLLELRAG